MGDPFLLQLGRLICSSLFSVSQSQKLEVQKALAFPLHIMLEYSFSMMLNSLLKIKAECNYSNRAEERKITWAAVRNRHSLQIDYLLGEAQITLCLHWNLKFHFLSAPSLQI